MRRLVIACAVGLAACQVPETGAPPNGGVVCTMIAVAGLSVAVSDSVTGLSLTSAKVVATSRTDAYADSTSAAFGGTYALAYEHAGTYDISVSAAGYAPWSRSGVVAAKTSCHVIPVQLSARMVKG
jgi:hypothetical protein